MGKRGEASGASELRALARSLRSLARSERLVDNPTKSCTSRPALAGLDLDPIQSFVIPALGGNYRPGGNGRRYENASRQSRLALPSTRTLRAVLSPEARSAAVRCGVRRAAGTLRTVACWWCTPWAYPHPPMGVGV